MLHSYSRVTAVLVFFASLLILTSHSTALADGPDFSNVNDILGGRRSLFRDDDMFAIQFPTNDDLRSTIMLTDGDAVSSQTDFVPSGGSNYATGIGRIFNLANDSAVTVIAGGVYLYSKTPTGEISQLFLNNLGGETVEQDVLAQADFTGDDLTEFAFIENGNINVFTAADINDPSQGFFYATPIPLPAGTGGPFSLAAGDFDADGVTELAVSYFQFGELTVTIFKPQATTNGQGNVTALSFNTIGSTAIFIDGPVPTIALTAGVYSGATNSANGISYAQLLLYYQSYDNQLPQAILQPILIAPATAPQVTLTLGNTLSLGIESSLIRYSLTSDYLDFFSNVEQAILMEQPDDGEAILRVLTFDLNLNVSIASQLTTQDIVVHTKISTGNFDQQNAQSSPLVLEIAAFGNLQFLVNPPDPAPPCFFVAGHIPAVTIFHVDVSNNYALSSAGTTYISDKCYEFTEDFPIVSGATGDLQGRSLYLGTPTRITSDSIQPHLILASPPMHVDYAAPSQGAQPEVLNLSTVPRAYYSTYQTKVSNQSQSLHQGATSFTNAANVAVTGGYTFRIPEAGSVSVTAGASAGYMNNKFIKKQYTRYSGSSFDASTTTGFGDQLWFTEETQNIYAFPVIGHYVCPEENPNCSNGEKVPQIILLSGPTITNNQTANGAQIEWYQPVHEPGNVFSYPWSLQQLKSREGNIDLLTSAQAYLTDDSTTTATASWSGQNSQSVTSGNTNQIKWGSFLSIVKHAGVLGGSTGSLKLSYNGSKAFSTLNNETTTLGESTGIGIVKPGTFANPDEFQYPFVPYIFGDLPVTGTVQTIPLNTSVQTSGILRAEFTADPTDSSAGSWWSQAYPNPDVALYHPARWLESVQNDSNDIPANCLRVSATGTPSDCMFFNPPQSDIWTSEFYWMKGLLITPADAHGEGPQIDHATAGDHVQLQARVYNNSLADMPTGSQIVVQFYGQPWNQSTHEPAGNAFLIENVSVPGLPGFNSTTNNNGGINPNWTTASTILNTTPYSDQYLAFWVLVVLKDAQGNPIPEMPGHGLTAIPPTLSSITDAAQWIEPYSNNVGFYKSTFYVAPAGSQTAERSAKRRISVDEVKVSKSRVNLGDKVIVSGLVRSNADTDGFAVLLFDGKPKQGRNIFDIEEVSHVRQNGTFLIKTVYHAQACGVHTLALKALTGKLSGETTLTVAINAKKAVNKLLKELKPLDLNDGRAGVLKELLQEAKKALKNKDTKGALDALHKFEERLKTMHGKQVPTDLANLMLSQLDQFFTCVKP